MECKRGGLWIPGFCVLACLVASTSVANSFPASRLSRQDDMTTVLSSTKLWFNEIYYRLSPELKATFGYSDLETRQAIEKEASELDGKVRRDRIKKTLESIRNQWKEEGFDVVTLQDRSAIGELENTIDDAGEDSSDSGLWTRAAITEPSTTPTKLSTPSPEPVRNTREPLVIHPQQSIFMDDIWTIIAQRRSSDDSSGFWSVQQSNYGDQLRVHSVPEMQLNGTVVILPKFAADTNSISDLVQITVKPAEMTLSQLLMLPDETFRMLSDDHLKELDANMTTSLAVQFAGDVTVTGRLILAKSSSMSDEELETLLNSLLNLPLSRSELKLLAELASQRWASKEGSWLAAHHSVLTLKRCLLAAHVPIAHLEALPDETVKKIVTRCRQVWLQSSRSEPLLGRYSRIWLKKTTATDIGPVTNWSAGMLTEKAPLLAGALAEELALIPSMRQVDSSTALSFAHLNRVQAQPILDGLLDSYPLANLHQLLRHLQPTHARRVHANSDHFKELTRWLFPSGGYEESTPYATHVQMRMILGSLPKTNVSVEDVYRLGPFLYTLPLHEVYSIYTSQVPLSVELLQSISSSLADPISRRLIMSMFLIQEGNTCEGCLEDVPSELLCSMDDTNLSHLRFKGLLTPVLVDKMLQSFDDMHLGKQAIILDTIRSYFRRPASREVRRNQLLSSKGLWSMSNPNDTQLLIPFILRHMEILSLELNADQLIKVAAEFPRKIVSQILQLHLVKQINQTWTSENLLGRGRSGNVRRHRPGIYLTGLDCRHIDAINPLDIIPIAEEMDRQLKLTRYGFMSLDVCVCLKKKITEYLRLKYALQWSPAPGHLIGANLQQMTEKNSLLSELTEAEAYAIPPCIMVFFSRVYLKSLPLNTRLVIWRRVADMSWPQLIQHILVQKNIIEFKWFAQQYMIDLNVSDTTPLDFVQVAQLNQLLHFVDDAVIGRIVPSAFRLWIYTLQTAEERMVCSPSSAWSSLILEAFGVPQAWGMSTPYHLGGWNFALNKTQRDLISRRNMRYALDGLLKSLFLRIPGVLDERGDGDSSFIAACRQLGDTNIDLRIIFESARLGGVVGTPRFREPQSDVGHIGEDIKALNVSLQSSLDETTVNNDTRDVIKSQISDVMKKMIKKIQRKEKQDSHMPFDYWSDKRLRCEDLRSAGPAAVAITEDELSRMASTDNLALWSCLNHLGSLEWDLSTLGPADIWKVASQSNSGVLSPDHILNLGGTVAALQPEELANVALGVSNLPLSADAISVLGSQRWSQEQLRTLINLTMAITDNSATSMIQHYSEPSYIVAMGNLLCGLSSDQLRQLFSQATRPLLYLDTSASIGRRLFCERNQPVETLAEMAVETFGETSRWDSLVVETVGAVVAGLKSWQLEDLSPAALRGLQPFAARRVVSAVIGIKLNEEQLASFSPPAAREMLAHPGLNQTQRKTLMEAIRGPRTERAAGREPPVVPADVSPVPEPVEADSEDSGIRPTEMRPDDKEQPTPASTTGDELLQKTSQSPDPKKTPSGTEKSASVKQAGSGGQRGLTTFPEWYYVIVALLFIKNVY